MRKINFLKIVLGVAVAMLVTVNASSQVYSNSDYERFSTDLTNGATHDDSIDYVTVNSVVRYYATPDQVYHPNYQVDGSFTANSTWAWTIPPAIPGTAYTAADNYVQITFPGAAAGYSINVTENASAAMGGCVGNPTYIYVSAIDAPTGTVAIVPTDLIPAIGPANSWQAITAGLSYQICGDQVPQTITMNFVEAVPLHYASYSFQVTREVDMIDGAGTVLGLTGADGAETVIANFPLGAGTQLSYANEGTLPGASFEEVGAGNFTFTFNSSDLDVLTAGTPALSRRTKYTYRVRTAGATVSATNTFVSNILAKSDYLAGTKRSVAFDDALVSFIVNPAPVTGTIYHIPNNYSY